MVGLEVHAISSNTLISADPHKQSGGPFLPTLSIYHSGTALQRDIIDTFLFGAETPSMPDVFPAQVVSFSDQPLESCDRL